MGNRVGRIPIQKAWCQGRPAKNMLNVPNVKDWFFLGWDFRVPWTGLVQYLDLLLGLHGIVGFRIEFQGLKRREIYQITLESVLLSTTNGLKTTRKHKYRSTKPDWIHVLQDTEAIWFSNIVRKWRDGCKTVWSLYVGSCGIMWNYVK